MATRNRRRSWALVSALAALAMPASCSLDGLEGPPIASDAGSDGSPEGPPPANVCGADLQRDPQNCGRCGRDCFGAPCESGACAATIFVQGEEPIPALAVNESFVVWTTALHVRGCSSADCTGGPKEIVGERDWGGALAMDSSVVVLATGRTSSNGIIRCRLPSCLEDDNSIMYDVGVGAVGLDGPDVFALKESGDAVVRCAAGDECVPSPPVIAKAPATGALAVGPQRVYWTALTPANAVYSALRSGGDATSDPLPPLATSQANPRSIAVGARDVFWANLDDGSVRACPLAGCAGAPRDVALGQAAPLGIAVDSERVYWANSGDGTVMSCAVDGCKGAPTVIARGLDRPVAIAIDARFAYVVTRNRTAIERFAK